MRGYMPGRFSFNVKGGRCEHCKGDGILKIEMQFLPDVYVPCEVCKGKRYNREALEIHYKGRSIADVLEMTIEEALDFFAAGARGAGQAADAQRRRPGLRPPRPAGHHALRRRGPARQAGHGAVAAGHRPDALRPRRAHHGSPHGRRREAAPRPPPPRRRRATRSSSSSTTWTWSRPPTGSSTWARRAATAAATSSPRARRRRWPAIPGSATGEYLARVLRGEPLVPLSAVTFAESSGHVPAGGGPTTDSARTRAQEAGRGGRVARGPRGLSAGRRPHASRDNFLPRACYSPPRRRASAVCLFGARGPPAGCSGRGWGSKAIGEGELNA